nr:carboxymuconolactone decarboxylase family protein [Candidatus Omnitrophota bacterium]
MSNRIQAIDPAAAAGKSRELMDGIQKGIGKVPNIFRGMANSPATLQAYLGFSGALKEGVL